MKRKAHLRWNVRLLRGVVLGFAAAAMLAPAAQARPEVDGSGPSAAVPKVIPYLSHGITAAPTAAFVRSDGPDGVRPETRVVFMPTAAADDGFEWQQYGLGAASGVLLALLVAGSLAGVRRREAIAVS
jgi:hypothetical protein